MEQSSDDILTVEKKTLIMGFSGFGGLTEFLECSGVIGLGVLQRGGCIVLHVERNLG